MENYITDAELTRTIKQRVKQAQEELYQGFDANLKAIALKESVIYVREVMEEILADFKA